MLPRSNLRLAEWIKGYQTASQENADKLRVKPESTPTANLREGRETTLKKNDTTTNTTPGIDSNNGSETKTRARTRGRRRSSKSTSSSQSSDTDGHYGRKLTVRSMTPSQLGEIIRSSVQFRNLLVIGTRGGKLTMVSRPLTRDEVSQIILHNPSSVAQPGSPRFDMKAYNDSFSFVESEPAAVVKIRFINGLVNGLITVDPSLQLPVNFGSTLQQMVQATQGDKDFNARAVMHGWLKIHGRNQSTRKIFLSIMSKVYGRELGAQIVADRIPSFEGFWFYQTENLAGGPSYPNEAIANAVPEYVLVYHVGARTKKGYFVGQLPAVPMMNSAGTPYVPQFVLHDPCSPATEVILQQAIAKGWFNGNTLMNPDGTAFVYTDEIRWLMVNDPVVFNLRRGIAVAHTNGNHKLVKTLQSKLSELIALRSSIADALCVNYQTGRSNAVETAKHQLVAVGVDDDPTFI